MSDSDWRGTSYSVPLWVGVRRWLRGEPGAKASWQNEMDEQVAAATDSVERKIEIEQQLAEKD